MKKVTFLWGSLILSAISFSQDASHLFINKKITLVAAEKKASDKDAPSAAAPFQDLHGLLNFSSDFKGLSVVPSINMWATQKFDSLKSQVSFQAFVGIPKHDSLLYNNALKLFLPEASQYGFSFKGQHQLFQKLNLKKQSLYLNWQAHLLGKSFVYTDTAKNKLDESSLVFHPRIGLDWVLQGGLLDLYCNLNGLMRLTNVEKFDRQFDNHKDLNLFMDAGFGIMVNLEKNDDPKDQVYLQIGGIFRGLDANNFIKSKDILTPIFKITLISKMVTLKPQTVTYDTENNKYKFTY